MFLFFSFSVQIVKSMCSREMGQIGFNFHTLCVHVFELLRTSYTWNCCPICNWLNKNWHCSKNKITSLLSLHNKILAIVNCEHHSSDHNLALLDLTSFKTNRFDSLTYSLTPIPQIERIIFLLVFVWFLSHITIRFFVLSCYSVMHKFFFRVFLMTGNWDGQ